jgi:DNA-binding protein YbaB
LDPSLLKEPKEFMQELLVAAFNDALQKIEKESRQKLSDLTHHMQSKFSSNIATT